MARASNRLMTLTGMLLALTLAACSGAASVGRSGESYTVISVEQLAQLLDQGDAITLVNTHVPYAGELPQTDLFIPFDRIGDLADELPARDAPIVLYCLSSGMSTNAAETLVALDFTDVMELDGGMQAWQRAGHEIVLK